MKWLFAVLVALNIIVFGSMVAYRTQHKTAKPESALEGGTHELLRPSSLDALKAEPQQASQPDWVVVESDGLIMAEPESEEAEALRKKQEAQQLKEKKEKMRREKEAQERRAAEEEMGAAGVERLCTSSATVVMDEDDPTLCGSDVVVGYLQEACQQTLDILAYIPSLRQHGSIDDREGHLQQTSDRLSQQGLTRTRGTEEEDVTLLDLNTIDLRGGLHESLIVIVDSDREVALSFVLTDDIVIEELLDLSGLGELMKSLKWGALWRPAGRRDYAPEELIALEYTVGAYLRLHPMK